MTMNRRALAFASAAVMASALLVGAAEARRDGMRNWELLGRQQVGFNVDRDVIHVGRRDGDFTRIKLRVEGNDVEFYDLKVVYGNGQRDDIRIRNRIRAGGETRAIDLKGGARFIRRVEMVYRSRPNFKGQAVVEVWGRD